MSTCCIVDLAFNLLGSKSLASKQIIYHGDLQIEFKTEGRDHFKDRQEEQKEA